MGQVAFVARGYASKERRDAHYKRIARNTQEEVAELLARQDLDDEMRSALQSADILASYLLRPPRTPRRPQKVSNEDLKQALVEASPQRSASAVVDKAREILAHSREPDFDLSREAILKRLPSLGVFEPVTSDLLT